ncbi:nucleotidyl transferase AbiEii/AbiGii toxin family protein [Desulfobacula phenolica]|uniref:Nucleotidyl transferase AbiEii toxin, Type IV TA system n=1 Tax=Desulfobacula phenolica TaxID=90732 RepID=A0A1H2K9K8_9BACT|nr:nucleotidyl transferase AbiEii/AbiGii toxin family protein [Desulfobacula phenolica]SDU65272.1 Nucleotidyl transferase AbiEii toxin, Type IV TA system [Desulfobacula phenolica]
MKMNKYFEQAKLMLSILPIVGQEKEFALKGGTALIFFYLNLPRLSVDIDLTFLPVKPRDETLAERPGWLNNGGCQARCHLFLKHFVNIPAKSPHDLRRII